MMKFFYSAMAGAVVFIGLSTAALADASVNKVDGTVLANSGRGYVSVPNSLSLPVGARVMANNHGAGEIVYDDGCRVQVKPGQVYTIASISPCKGAEANHDTSGSGMGLSNIAIGAIGLGAAIAIGVAVSNNGNDSSYVSP